MNPTPSDSKALAEAAKWLHAAYDRPPQTPEAKAMLARIDAALTTGVSPSVPAEVGEAVADLDAAKRLRLICKLLGLESAIPDDDASLMGCLFPVLGMIRRNVEERLTPAEPKAQAQPPAVASEAVQAQAGVLTDSQIDGLFEHQRDPVQVGSKPYVCLDREAFHEIARCIEAMSTPSPPPREQAAPSVGDAIDPAGVPKIKATYIEHMAVRALNMVKAWRDSDGNEPFPHEAREMIDAVLMTYEQRRTRFDA
jgi:hypothetical protein